MLTAMPAATTSVLGTVTLVTGSAELLSERTVGRVVAAVSATDPDADLTPVSAAQVRPGGLAELTSPSLFAAARAVVIRDLQDLPDDVHDDVVAYALDPAADVALVLVHFGGPKGKRLLDRLRQVDGVHEVKSEAPKPWEMSRFVAAEVRHHRGTITEDAAEFLVGAIGPDLRALASAAEQLVGDFAPERITTEIVRRYYDGRAEVTGFDIADAAISGSVAGALERLRWARHNREELPKLLGAFAFRLRALARLHAAPRGLREVDLAREVGATPHQLRTLRDQLRSWDEAGLAEAIRAVAQADLDVKGGVGDPDHALERMVLTVTRARGRHPALT